jgi:hypothetical protein
MGIDQGWRESWKSQHIDLKPQLWGHERECVRDERKLQKDSRSTNLQRSRKGETSKEAQEK